MDTKVLSIIIIVIFLVISLIVLGVFLYLFFKQKNKYKKLISEMNELKKTKLEDYIKYISNDDKKRIDDYFKNYFNKLQNEKIQEFQKRKESKLMQVIESLVFFNEWRNKVTTTVVPENLEMIPRLIGKDGINKRYIENELNILMTIDKPSSKGVIISSHSLYRKEIAKRVIEKLLSSSTIDKNRIEKYKEEVTKELDEEIINVGKKAFETLNVKRNYHEKIFYYIGLLQYRTSYFQNILSHSLEVAFIADKIAKLIGVDHQKAKLCAFFHDIGKSIDIVNSNGIDHVEQGIIIAKECGLEEEIIHTIESHHNKVVTQNIYASITILSDKISGSMPNARINSDALVSERCSKIEMLCNNIEGVKKTYAIKSGNELRVILEGFNGNLQERFLLVAEEVKNKLITNFPEFPNIDIVICANFEYKTKTNE